MQGIYLIPFVGGAAVAKHFSMSRWQNAFIAINGPIWGTALAIVCLADYFATGESLPVLAAVGVWSALINLFNLLPVLPLDGGRILTSLAYSFSGLAGRLTVVVSLFVGGMLAYVAVFELLVLVTIVGLFEFANHLSAASIASGTRRLGESQPIGKTEFAHFDGLVSQVQSEKVTKVKSERFEQLAREGLQVPMSLGQSAIVVVRYLCLTTLLIGSLWWFRDLPGAGNPIEFLK